MLHPYQTNYFLVIRFMSSVCWGFFLMFTATSFCVTSKKSVIFNISHLGVFYKRKFCVCQCQSYFSKLAQEGYV